MGEFRMPSLGADMVAATLMEWFVKPGDQVKKGDIIADVATDKGDIDVEVFEEGVIEKIMAQPGQKLPVGTPLAYIRSEGDPSWKQIEATIDKTEIKPEPKPAPEEAIPQSTGMHEQEMPKPVQETPPVAPYPAPVNGMQQPLGERIKASPLARKIALEKGIDLHQVIGTRPNGAIGRADVERTIAQIETQKQETVAHHPPEDAHTGMRRAIAAAMSRSNREIPHYYLETHVDMSHALAWLEAENRRRSVKERLLAPVLFVKALAKALAEVPVLNGYWINDQLQMQEAIHIGFAIALRQGGLVAPAIQHADMKSLDELMENILDLTKRVRTGRLRSSELTDATITLTSLGERVVETVYGVIYPPQVALLGLGKIKEQPWVEHGLLGVRPVVHVTLAADHRATDGHQGALLLEAFDHYLQDATKLCE